jgi:cytochrome c
MKSLWILCLSLMFAGCQREVQEAPVARSVVQSGAGQEAAAKLPEPPAASVVATAITQPVTPVSPRKESATVASKAKTVGVTTLLPPQVSEPVTADRSTAVVPPVAVQVVAAKLSEREAMSLAKKKNCFACHALDKKVVGPAWKAVAEKYRGDAGALAALETKVRKGGKGVWGGVAMPPQTALSEAELTGLVQFVLQLK